MKTTVFNGCIAKGAGTGACSSYKCGRFCNTHRSQYRTGRIDINGKEKRKKVFYRKKISYHSCIAKGAGTGDCSASYRPGSRFCARHKYQKKVGLIDDNGKKLRDKIISSQKKFTHCIAKKSAGPCGPYKGGRFCYRHRYHWEKGIIDDAGNKTDKDLSYERTSECVAKGKDPSNPCSGKKYGKWCLKHQSQFYDKLIDENGHSIRPFLNGPAHKREQCAIPGCRGVKGFNGFCRKHYIDIIKNEKFEEYPSIIPVSKFQMKEKKKLWHQQ